MTTAAELESRSFGPVTAYGIPAVVRGVPRMPAWPRVREVRDAVAATGTAVGPTESGSLLLARPMVDRNSLAPTGRTQLLVLPAVDPRELPEPDPARAVRELAGLPVAEVCAFVDAVGAALAASSGSAHADLGLADPDTCTSMVDDRLHRANRVAVAGLFDGGNLRRQLAVELGDDGLAALDGWVALDGRVRQGVTAGMAERDRDLRAAPRPARPAQIRGLPTTQLHITAGNSPAVPFSSLLWGWASKGACVLKPAAGLAALVCELATRAAAVDPDHPLVRHTTVAYWRGGDRRVESRLLAGRPFDRAVVWGGDEAVRAVEGGEAARDTIVLRSRQAVSLIDGTGDLSDAARRGAADSVVADQQACMSSLLHVVVGEPAAADAYAQQLLTVLASWDDRLPHRTPGPTLGRLQELRRGLLATADWQINGRWPAISSAVVRWDRAFDLRRHPGGRLVLVSSAPNVTAALTALLGGDVSHIGVDPTLLDDGTGDGGLAGSALRDHLAAAGVDNVLPLGAAEQVYAGRPHDGMRVLTRLVRWVNG